jgi:hypothetical protein
MPFVARLLTVREKLGFASAGSCRRLIACGRGCDFGFAIGFVFAIGFRLDASARSN